MQKSTLIATAGLFLTTLVCGTAAFSETTELEDVTTSKPAAVTEEATEAVEAVEEAAEEAVEDAEEAVEEAEEAAKTVEEAAEAETAPDAGFGAGEVQESAIPKASDIREEIEQTGVKVYVNNPPSRYTLLKKIRSEVYVIDAKSESDAEVLAFKKLKERAKELGADGLIEVKRSILKDSVAQLEAPVVTGSMLGMDIDSTAVPVDELMLSNYSMNKGMLSNRIIEKTFDRSEVSQRAIRFTGKAIKLVK